jgi:hypothetical protein
MTLQKPVFLGRDQQKNWLISRKKPEAKGSNYGSGLHGIGLSPTKPLLPINCTTAIV